MDFPSQTVTFSTHVGGWNAFPLIERIKEMTGGVPTLQLDNDANTRPPMGESHYGAAGRGYDPLLYMTISTGIGGGIVWQHLLAAARYGAARIPTAEKSDI